MPNKHTPGPWHRNIKPARKYPTVWAGRNKHVAAVVPGAPYGSGNGADMSDEELEANIDLIAAAPEMLAALKRQRDNIKHWLETGTPATPCESKSIFDQIESAIAKATGGSNAD